MKTLLILKGVMGSGKSTFVQENNLENYTISPDELRKLYGGIDVDINGKDCIPFNINPTIFKALFEMVEFRMKKGSFIVIDAMHLTNDLINVYRDLAKKYKYSVYVKVFDLTLNELLDRNNKREILKRLDTSIIEKNFNKFDKKVPSWCKEINNVSEILDFYTYNADNYKDIKVIGDLQGCYSVLKENVTFNDDTLYIFVGDFFDRGIENDKVYVLLKEIYKNDNVILLEGNHERHLFDYVYGNEIRSTEFLTNTLVQLLTVDKESVLKKYLKDIYKRTRQLLKLEFNGKKYLISHTGVTGIYKDILLYNTNDFIRGVGGYDIEIGELYTNNIHLYNDYKQIHGHRHCENAENSICLEDKVEFGGNLRVYHIEKDNETLLEYKNDVFSKEIVVDSRKFKTTNEEINKLFTKTKLLKVKEHPHNLVSINFKKDVFYKKQWNEVTEKARGLYVDKNTGDVKIKGYQKFFNIDEIEKNKIENLDKLEYPIYTYEKANGFLGLVSVVNDELILASKSTIDSKYVDYFRSILDKVPYVKKQLFDLSKKYNCTFTFEVIHNEDDTHIVDYQNKNFLVLLDAIENKFEKGYNKEFSDKIINLVDIPFDNEYITKKLQMKTINNYSELLEFIDVVDNTDNAEGVVLVDSNNYMVKLKNKWYTKWKMVRSFIESLLKNPNLDYDTTFIKEYFNATIKRCENEEYKKEFSLLLEQIYDILEKDNFIQLKEYKNVKNFREKLGI